LPPDLSPIGAIVLDRRPQLQQIEAQGDIPLDTGNAG
jgi:hypothetical protein